MKVKYNAEADILIFILSGRKRSTSKYRISQRLKTSIAESSRTQTHNPN